jgi:hypothetical protein
MENWDKTAWNCQIHTEVGHKEQYAGGLCWKIWHLSEIHEPNSIFMTWASWILDILHNSLLTGLTAWLSPKLPHKVHSILLLYICVCVCVYNNQIKALFFLSLMSYHTSTCQFTVSRPGQAHWQSTQQYNKYHLPHIHILPPDDGLLICLTHIECVNSIN